MLIDPETLEAVATAIMERRIKPDMPALLGKHWAVDHDMELAKAAITAYLTHAGEGAVPVGWQWRGREKLNDRGGFGEWSDWMYGKAPGSHSDAYQFEERPLYAAPRPPRQDGAREGDDARLQELQEIADGAWGDGPMRRGQARDLLMKATTPPAPDEAVEAEREACAKLVEPTGPRPCNCDWCDCGNAGDAEAVARWDAETLAAKAIRARSRRDVGGV